MGQGVLDDVVDIGTQVSTLGLFGFDRETGFKAGVTGKPIVEGAKEITGAAAAEEANVLAREQFEKDEARIRKQREDTQLEHEKRQVALSKGASRARGTSQTVSGQGSTLDTQTDFLGL